MVNSLTMWQRLIWLLVVLAWLSLSAAAAAHAHPHDSDSDGGQVVDECLLCQVASHKAGPAPSGRLQPLFPAPRYIGRLIPPAGDSLFSRQPGTKRVRGPPRL